MIDTYLRKTYQSVLVDPILGWIVRSRVSPNTLTLAGLASGVLIAPALAFGFPIIALVFLLISGYFDTLDGSLARVQKKSTAKGAILDIVSDRVVEFSIILGLFLVEPETRGLLSLLMLGSVLICITTFLVVGIFADNESEKGFHYSPGLMERTEAFLFFGAMILLPSQFILLGSLFTALVAFTAAFRITQFYLSNPEAFEKPH